jgi:conjugal transfer mating pair stabilization protein TraG
VAGASIQGNAGKSYQTGLSEEQRKVLGSMTNEQIAEFKQFGDRVSRDTTFITAASDDSRESKELASRLSTATSRAQRAEATFAERQTLADRLSSAREQGETISIDLAQDPHNMEMFLRYAERYGGSSAAAFAMLDSELARQGLRPNRVLSDGAALPASFDDLRRRHDQSRGSAPLGPDISSTDRGNSRRVSGFGRSTPKAEEMPQPSAIRSEVERKGSEIRQGAESSQGGFEAEAQMVRSADGTLTTKKSLLMQSGRQVAADATESIDSAKDLAKDLIKRKK